MANSPEFITLVLVSILSIILMTFIIVQFHKLKLAVDDPKSINCFYDWRCNSDDNGNDSVTDTCTTTINKDPNKDTKAYFTETTLSSSGVDIKIFNDASTQCKQAPGATGCVDFTDGTYGPWLFPYIFDLEKNIVTRCNSVLGPTGSAPPTDQDYSDANCSNLWPPSS